MDFYYIRERTLKDETIEIYPDFQVVRSKDLMIRGRSFYAIWDEEAGLWSTDEYDVRRLVDKDLDRYKKECEEKTGRRVKVKHMGNFSSGMWRDFRSYMTLLTDNAHQLDETVTFANTDVKKKDYVSKRLPYPLTEGDYSSWDELVGTLYTPENREKIEWAIGAILSGDSKKIQKFLVFYGPPGSGKSTILNIIMMMLEGYTITFEAKALTQANNAFSTEVFKSNPLLAVQHDGDLSGIRDNSKLNSIVAHEPMSMNEKFKPSYTATIAAFLMMGTNTPVLITDSKSGLIRRLIDVQPSGSKIPGRKYSALMAHIQFELGAIAWHCLETYREMGKDYYELYQPIEMMMQTNVFYNFIESYFDVFRSQQQITLKQGYDMYKEFCEEANVEYKLPLHKFREELKNYFAKFEERAVVDGLRVRSLYSEFISDKFDSLVQKTEKPLALILDETESLLDREFADQPAQYSKLDGTPALYWSDDERISNGKTFTPRPNQVVSTKLADIDTRREHYVKPPENHIVIDFDLKGDDGEKSTELNLEAASLWPMTYAEFSKSGAGIHLHYDYIGDASELSRLYSDGIEIKVFTGDSSLRRKLSKCNNIPIAKLSSGLPLKEKKMINTESIKSEKALRDLIQRNMQKQVHHATKPSMDFIHKILEEAYSSGLAYDVEDLRPRLIAFANNSTNQATYCLRLALQMKYKSEKTSVQVEEDPIEETVDDLAFFDCEVFPNLFIISWSYMKSDKVVRLVNPKPHEVAELFKLKLVGFNVRKYDNHIMYAASLGYSLIELYNLSQKLINNEKNATFGQAYDISYADIYDFSSKKMSLKKFQIELGLNHLELGLPWDQPVPEELWDQVGIYCDNDVISEKEVFKDRYGDFVARQILADLSGLSINASTQQHTARIIFGKERNPQGQFKYTNLADIFPGYTFEKGKSSFMGEDPSEGGYVYAEPGMYENVAVLDIASMHPTSIEELELFGPYTKNYSALKAARIAIKRGEYEHAKTLYEGRLAKYLTDESSAETLSYALKIVINIVYGLTSAKFPNAFRDNRNVDNIVAKRGALFMIQLKHKVQEKGFTVAHIKTDSIKIPNATTEIIEFCMEEAEKFGYEFEHEATYDRMALVNNAVYIAWVRAGRKPAHWEAVGAQFQHPYVFKKLFSHEEVDFQDVIEAKAVVGGAIYIDEEDFLSREDFEQSMLKFVGKVGLFTPVKEKTLGGTLLREKDGKFSAVTGTKGYSWAESNVVEAEKGWSDIVDWSYFDKLVDAAKDNIGRYGDFEWFVEG